MNVVMQVHEGPLTRLSKAEMSKPSTVPTGARRLYRSSKLTAYNYTKCTVLMRDEKEGSKQGQTNNKAKQHSTHVCVYNYNM